MESLKRSLYEINDHFNATMAEFQKELKGAIPATSPSSNINSQFVAFRSFVMTALENLQLQVELLARQQDELEMRSRRKILLVHGIAEGDKEDPSVSVCHILSQHLKLSKLSAESFSRCHRLGGAGGDRPRAVLIKFRDWSLRDTVWSAKTKLKGTGVTLSEFLIKSRHKTFLAARQRFGVAKCWTRDGNIVVLDSDGKRHRITSMSELNAIPAAGQDVPRAAVTTAASAATGVASKDSRLANSRLKRVVRK
ncbi:uncharacterized protein LOC120636989 [Pararge aegeria]|uniref:uncharacterized protein LOC120625954 n=1 Tax=Pararge aegeria TaxID=116150 RepID=UPI0019D2107F|nr:uncharacterized protein LOC120625954 [Pararge aegeria]XP_039749231.1 uncharacterized protein LOC120626019 [Pararge aegeria]XP_039752022.1 uncharacterized protein LOC120627957 [Pararge aegeria]XP_039764502.1 uncharacterized protein LOC120636989 [Pararge aegeria]